jgi:hypothetical protein
LAITVLFLAAVPASAQSAGSVQLTPARGPVGARVTFEGTLDPAYAASLDDGSQSAFLVGHPFAPDICELGVNLEDVRLHGSPSGEVSGSFVIGSRGGLSTRP